MEKAARYFIYDNMLSMTAYWLCSGTVVAALTSYFKIPVALANLLTGLPSTLLLLQLAGGYFYQRSKKRLFFLRVSGGVWRLVLPLAFFSVLLPRSAGAALMSLSIVLFVGIVQFASPGQTDWMVGYAQGRVRGSYYSMRETGFILTYTVIFCVSSIVLDRSQRAGRQEQGFLIIGAIVTGLLVVSTLFFARLPAPEPQPQESRPTRSLLWQPIRDRGYRQVLLVNALWSLSAMFGGGFSSVYQVRVLNMDFSTIMLWSTVASLCRTVATPLFGRLSRTLGWRRISMGCILLMAASYLLWGLSSPGNIHLLYPALAVMGAVPYAGLGVGLLTMQVDAADPAARGIYFSVTSTLNGLASLLGSVLTSGAIQLIESLMGPGSAAGMRGIFMVGAAGALASAVAVSRVKTTR